MEGVYTETPDVLGRVGKVDLTNIFPLLFENAGDVIIDKGLGLGPRNRVHVDRFQTPRKTHVAWFVGFDHDIAGATLNRQFKPVIEDFSMKRHG